MATLPRLPTAAVKAHDAMSGTCSTITDSQPKTSRTKAATSVALIQVSPSWASMAGVDYAVVDHPGFGRHAGVGVEVLQGQHGVEVGVAAEPAHPGVHLAPALLPGGRIEAAGAGQAEAVERPPPSGVVVVAAI